MSSSVELKFVAFLDIGGGEEGNERVNYYRWWYNTTLTGCPKLSHPKPGRPGQVQFDLLEHTRWHKSHLTGGRVVFTVIAGSSAWTIQLRIKWFSPPQTLDVENIAGLMGADVADSGTPSNQQVEGLLFIGASYTPLVSTVVSCTDFITSSSTSIQNPLGHHDALKHHFTSLKTYLIFLQLRVLDNYGKFGLERVKNHIYCCIPSLEFPEITGCSTNSVFML